MSLTMREARDVQLLAAWFERLRMWELAEHVDETAVAEALLRLTFGADSRLMGTGQGNGLTSARLARGEAITWMVVHGTDLTGRSALGGAE